MTHSHNKQIELVETFADQAVIAIENVRLFDEVQARTRDLDRGAGAADRDLARCCEVIFQFAWRAGTGVPGDAGNMPPASAKPSLAILYRYDGARIPAGAHAQRHARI